MPVPPSPALSTAPRRLPLPMPTVPVPDPTAADAPEAAPEPSYAERPSKTRRKAVSHELQDLGAAAVALPDDRLAALPIAGVLLDAIRDYRRTRTHEARRRQMQYIGKLMRVHEVEPIRQAVADLQLGRAKDALALHDAERWRAELIADDDAATRWAREHPQADLQQLRSLVRAARKDAALAPEQRSGRAFRELFRFIRQTDDE